MVGKGVQVEIAKSKELKMSKLLICLGALAAITVGVFMPEPAPAGARNGCVEGGYGLGWYGGRPYYYRPFGVYGGSCDQYRPRPYYKRFGNRYRSYGYR
jgi:hypothetical protein